MKKIVSLLITTVMLLSLAACSSSGNSVEQGESSTDAGTQNGTLGAFDAENIQRLTVQPYDTEEKEPVSTDFASANILTFTTESTRDNTILDYEAVLGVIETSNVGDHVVTDLKLYVSILDISNTERGTGTAICRYAVEPNKTVFAEGLWEVSEKNTETIVVTAYDYVTNQEKYHIDLINNTAVKWAVEIGNAEFGEKNILAFSFTGMGAANNGETYRCAINIQNNSDSFITVLSANVIFLDTDGNYLDETTTYEREVSANTSVEQERYTYMDETRLSKISKIGVASYTYWFEEPDEDGYKGYKIDLLNMTATGLLG